MEKLYMLSGIATATGLLAAATACIGCIGTGLLSDSLIAPDPKDPAVLVFMGLMLIGGLLTGLFVVLRKWIAKLEAEHENQVNPSGNELHDYKNEYYDYFNNKINF